MRLQKERPSDVIHSLPTFFLSGKTERLSTLNSTEEELWLELERLRNEDFASRFISGVVRNKAHRTMAAKLINKYINHAVRFYKDAQRVDSASSPLLYYYSFLNLAKAYIACNNPERVYPVRIRNSTFDQKFLQHGLFAGDKVKGSYQLRDEVITAKSVGIFATFFELLSGGIYGAGYKEKITNLLGNCQDISSEYCKIHKRHNHFYSFDLALLADSKSKNAWLRLNLDKRALSSEIRIGPSEVLKRNSGLTGFKLVKSNRPTYHTLELQNMFTYTSTADLLQQGRQKILPLGVTFSSHHERTDYALPIGRGPVGAFETPSELLSIYMLMYYFGSVTRYQPAAFEKIFIDEDGWLVKSFLRTCPKKFIRLFVPLLFQRHYQMEEF